MTLRSPQVEVNEDFAAEFQITKAVRHDGRRIIRGVASGILEDRDGERVSRRALREFVAEGAGIPLVTSTHRDDWDSKIGKVTTLDYDADSDELIAEAELSDGDPMAEKAWNEVNKPGSRIGYSIGGKLRDAFFEKTDTGKRRKVLNSIRPRHLALTENPSYAHSFAEAVAKTFTGDPPPDDEWVDDDDVVKDASSQVQDGGGGPAGDRNAGTKTDKQPSRDVNTSGDDDEDETKDLPKARHLACPNCGHEFAADLPADLMDNDTSRDEKPGRDDTDQDAHKSAQETPTTMPETKSIEDTLKTIRDLATDAAPDADETIAKTDDTPEPDKAEQAKDEGQDDVLKIVAASHRKHEDDIDTLREATREGFELVTKALQGVQESVASLPRGRRSIARTARPAETEAETDDGVAKTFDGDDADDSIEKRIADADSPAEAIKALNEKTYGIR